MKEFLFTVLRKLRVLWSGRSPSLHQINPSGTLQMKGRLEVMKISGKSVQASEQLDITEQVVAVVRRDHITAIRVADSSSQSLAANILDDGSVDYLIQGRSRKNEEGNLEVCKILLDRLNQEGGCWRDLRNVAEEGAREERGVDCEARDDTEVLAIQVTRAEREGNVWKRLAQTSETSAKLSAEEAADSLRNAIDKKARKTPLAQRAEIILALDATETVSHTFEPVLRSFAERHGSWARSLNFRGMWIIGPNVSLTSRLDR